MNIDQSKFKNLKLDNYVDSAMMHVVKNNEQVDLGIDINIISFDDVADVAEVVIDLDGHVLLLSDITLSEDETESEAMIEELEDTLKEDLEELDRQLREQNIFNFNIIIDK